MFFVSLRLNYLLLNGLLLNAFFRGLLASFLPVLDVEINLNSNVAFSRERNICKYVTVL